MRFASIQHHLIFHRNISSVDPFRKEGSYTVLVDSLCETPVEDYFSKNTIKRLANKRKTLNVLFFSKENQLLGFAILKTRGGKDFFL